MKGEIQRLELGRGCPHQHDYCYEPAEIINFPIPKIVRNQVQILDMNFLARKDAFEVIKELASKRVNDKVIHYELICGIHFSYINQELADLLKASRFVRPRIAWDGSIEDQMKIKDAVKILV